MVTRERNDKKKSYRWCMVPSCKSTSVSTPDKRFVSVPKAKKIRLTWLKAVKRDAFNKMPSPKSTMYCCEDHFNMEEDMENFMRVKMIGGYLKAKESVVPHIFEKQKSPKNSPKKLDHQSLGDYSSISNIDCTSSGNEPEILHGRGLNDEIKVSEKYCIVEFEKTGDIAAVPRVWIKNSSNNIICLWPTKNVLFAIRSCKEPKLSSWSSHTIKILHSFDTYEEARKAEQDAQFDLNFNTEPENDLGRGKRKKFQKRQSDSDDDNDPILSSLKHKTPERRASVEHKTSTRAAEVAVKLNTNIISMEGDETSIQERLSETIETEANHEIVNNEGTLQEQTNVESVTENIQSQIHENSALENSHHVDSGIENGQDEVNDSVLENSLDQIQDTSVSKNREDQMHDSSVSEHRQEETHRCCSCKDMLQKVIQELKSLRKEFGNFRKSFKEFRRPTMTTDAMIGDGLNFEFPLKSFLEIDTLEKELLRCQEKRKKMVENMIQIGGVNVNDTVKRLLKGLFSDGLAQNFSWEGRNGKRELKGLLLMDILFVAIQNVFGKKCPDATARNIKYRIREWLKLACARQLTKEKRRENSISVFSLSENSTNLADVEMDDFHIDAETSDISIIDRERRSRFGNESSCYEPRLVISDVQSQRYDDDIEIIEPVIKTENVENI